MPSAPNRRPCLTQRPPDRQEESPLPRIGRRADLHTLQPNDLIRYLDFYNLPRPLDDNPNTWRQEATALLARELSIAL